MSTITIPRGREDEGATRRSGAWRLVLAQECARPLAGSSCHGLERIDRVLVGRGAARRVVSAGRELLVEVAYPWMSSRHACLERDEGGWTVSDLGSKNGTLV